MSLRFGGTLPAEQRSEHVTSAHSRRAGKYPCRRLFFFIFAVTVRAMIKGPGVERPPTERASSPGVHRIASAPVTLAGQDDAA